MLYNWAEGLSKVQTRLRVILQEDNEKRSGKAALIRGWPQGQKGSTILQGNLGRREWTITSKKCYDEFIFVLHATKVQSLNEGVSHPPRGLHQQNLELC
uniref:Uncharacterized protein n=1 Tax=Vitis vinifera TaxID=29760 RepID=F6I504_VITVI